MRIWSIHPEHLDSKGLVALWRETLLAKHVLEGKTKGYKNHPQLNRFKAHPQPLSAIHHYLEAVYEEALNRGFHFDETKFERKKNVQLMEVTTGQMTYETQHLLNKLAVRDPERFDALKSKSKLKVHPLFTVVKGAIAPWEIV